MTVGQVLLLSAATSSLSEPAFTVVWNAPSAGCRNKANLTIADYSVRVNANQSFNGSEVVLFYKLGAWPTLNATLDHVPCWTPHNKSDNCSWSPWGDIAPETNGGVPQAADLDAHGEELAADLTDTVPDPNFDGFLIIDWEAWRPLAAENNDGMGCYLEYSRRLVAKDPGWAGKNSTEVSNEANRRFEAGARSFFTATVMGVRRLRPLAKIGFYSQGIEQAIGNGDNLDLVWLWDIVDVLAPSIYPRSANATADAAWNARQIEGAVLSASIVKDLRDARGDPTPRPLVMPYARALVNWGGGPFTEDVLAAQVQVAAGLGVEGVFLWGSSADYQTRADCAMLETEIVGWAGAKIQDCIANRELCSSKRCHGVGRCIDFLPDRLTDTCLTEPLYVKCRCDPGYTGPYCAEKIGLA